MPILSSLIFILSLLAAPSTASAVFSSNLSFRGAQSTEQVKELQQFLTDQGLFTEEVSGNFYTQTYLALVAFQKQEGITPASGYFGPLTRARANTILADGTGGDWIADSATTQTASAYSASSSSRAGILAQIDKLWAELRSRQKTTAVEASTDTSASPASATAATPAVAVATAAATNSSVSKSTTKKPSGTTTSSGSTTTTTTPTPPATVPASTSGIKWGAYVTGGSNLSSLESLVGKQASLLAVFTSFDDSFPSSYKSSLCASGKTLVIFWESYGHSLDGIASGKDDAYLRSFSSAAASYGCPVILAPFHEMNGNWDDWDGTVGNNSPAKLIAAWKHMHDLVTASNVKWAWAVNSDSVPDTAANAIGVYYPGSAYVDYVAVDGFNFGSPWQSFSSVFSSALAQLKTYGKPIYILSMASASGTQKAAWITDALTVQIPKAGIAGWIWFNENKEQNWLVNSDSASLTAFKAGVN